MKSKNYKGIVKYTLIFHCLVATFVPTPVLPNWNDKVLQLGLASTYTKIGKLKDKLYIFLDLRAYCDSQYLSHR